MKVVYILQSHILFRFTILWIKIILEWTIPLLNPTLCFALSVRIRKFILSTAHIFAASLAFRTHTLFHVAIRFVCIHAWCPLVVQVENWLVRLATRPVNSLSYRHSEHCLRKWQTLRRSIKNYGMPLAKAVVTYKWSAVCAITAMIIYVRIVLKRTPKS